MSFSSDTSLDSSSSSTSSSPPGPPPPPNYKTLESLLLSLIVLTRQAFRGDSRRRHFTTAYEFARLRSKISNFFARHHQNDFVADETYGYCLEISIMLGLIERALPVETRGYVEGLVEVVGQGEERMDGDERKKIWKSVNMDVELLIFRGAELDCARLPWNLGGNLGRM